MRAKGFYWVKPKITSWHDKEWEPAYFDGNRWFLIGDDSPHDEGPYLQIGPPVN